MAARRAHCPLSLGLRGFPGDEIFIAKTGESFGETDELVTLVAVISNS